MARKTDDQFSGFSTSFSNRAREREGRRRELAREYEPPEDKGRIHDSKGYPDALKPRVYYNFISDGQLVIMRGDKFDGGVKPANLELLETKPPLVIRIKDRLEDELGGTLHALWSVRRERTSG